MTKFTIRLAMLAVVGSAVAIGCGDDGTTAVDNGPGTTEATAPTMASMSALEVEVGDVITLTTTVTNPDAIDLRWAIASTTIEGLAELGQLEGTNTGATFTFDASADLIGTHEITVSAAYGSDGEISQTGTVTIEPEPCYYPSNVGFGRGLAFPDFAWNASYHDGTPVILDLYDFHCNDEEWGRYESMLVMITADWCPNCPAYMEWIDALSDQLEEAGMLIFFLDVQDTQGRTTFTEPSNAHIGNYTPNGAGIRAGDGDNVQPDGVMNSGLIEYFPTSFVLRREDMSLIADQRDTSYYLPLVEIAQDPNADWSSPPAPGIVPALPTNCDESDEESFEPNNNASEAGTIVAGDVVDGGVCDSQPDFYYVDIEGAWTVNVEFSTGVGDLDVYVYDVDAQAPMQGDNGSAIGSESTTDDESFSHAGPSTIMVYGFRGATAPYTLTVTAD